MANPLMMRYAASRGNERENRETRNEMRGGNRNEMDGNIGEEMRRYNRDEMRGEYDGAESRYRGKDGRWRSGTRRSEYDEMRREFRSPMSAEDDDEEEKGRKYKIEVLPNNVIQWPGYDEPVGNRPIPSNDYRTSRQIGFGATNNMHEGNSMNREHEMGMARTEPMEFDRETAEHWVRNMRNEDKAHPAGGKWSADMLKPLAMKYGVPTEGAKFWEFFAMTNAMYSDYGEVAKKFGITSPEFYACMAKAWMEDKDAEPDKTALYYEYIVKK